MRKSSEIVSACLAGFGQIFFCESPTVGLLILLGFFAIDPFVLGAGAIAGLIATSVSKYMGYPELPWRQGLYGYSGVLIGLFWGMLFSPEAVSFLILLVLAGLSAPLSRWGHSCFTPREIPALAVPALSLIWLGGIFLEPQQLEHVAYTDAQFLGLGLVAGGLFLYSRLMVLSVVAGGMIGLGLSEYVVGQWSTGILANCVFTAVALSVVFLPWSFPSMMIASLGSILAGLLWWLGIYLLGGWNIPILVAPFCLVTIFVLQIIRIPGVRRWVPGRPLPLSLHELGHPEEKRKEWLARGRLRKLVRRSKSIFVLTGAGVSTGAGLPDFKSPSDFWGGHKRISIDDFSRSPRNRKTYWEQDEKFFQLVRGASPSLAHHALSALYGSDQLSVVVTQNVDGLDLSAGIPAEGLIELHGNINKVYCMDCGQTEPRENLSAMGCKDGGGTYCKGCRGILKSGSLMFGENVEPRCLEKAMKKLLASDLLLVLGTSLEVSPARDFLIWARDLGIPIAIVNATPTKLDDLAEVTVSGDVGDILTDLLAEKEYHFGNSLLQFLDDVPFFRRKSVENYW